MTMTYNGDNGIQIDGNLVINNYPENSSMDFDLIEFESLINDMYSCCFNKSGGGFDFVQIKIEEKNRINKLEFYFNEKIKKTLCILNPFMNLYLIVKMILELKLNMWQRQFALLLLKMELLN